MNKNANTILILAVIILIAGITGLMVWTNNKTKTINQTSNQVAPNSKSTNSAPSSTMPCNQGGGKISDITECNGEINKICTLSNGNTCYIENLKDGKCEGTFSPKVLCDKNQ